jgi:hypothetical protein
MQGSPFLGSVPFFRATDRQIDMLVRSYEEIMVFSNHPFLNVSFSSSLQEKDFPLWFWQAAPCRAPIPYYLSVPYSLEWQWKLNGNWVCGKYSRELSSIYRDSTSDIHYSFIQILSRDLPPHRSLTMITISSLLFVSFFLPAIAKRTGKFSLPLTKHDIPLQSTVQSNNDKNSQKPLNMGPKPDYHSIATKEYFQSRGNPIEVWDPP